MVLRSSSVKSSVATTWFQRDTCSPPARDLWLLFVLHVLGHCGHVCVQMIEHTVTGVPLSVGCALLPVWPLQAPECAEFGLTLRTPQRPPVLGSEPMSLLSGAYLEKLCRTQVAGAGRWGWGRGPSVPSELTSATSGTQWDLKMCCRFLRGASRAAPVSRPPPPPLPISGLCSLYLVGVRVEIEVL